MYRALLLLIIILSSLEMSNANSCKIPKLIGFDLDGTIWSPDMYQLWGGECMYSFFIYII